MKKINKKGFFLSETMVVIAVVAVVILSVFKLFNSVYYRFIETENYNTANAINALSNIKKYFESIGPIDTELITEDISYVDLTNNERYQSEYYTRLKDEFKIDSVYLIDLNKLSNANDFHIQLKRYLDTLKNKEGIILLISINGKEFAYAEILHYSTVTLIGDEEDEFGVYIQLGDEFIDPGYTNWDGDEPTTTWENDEEVNTSKRGTYYLHYDFNGKIFRRKVVVGDFVNDFAYTGSYQVYEVPYDGYYKVELWGAEGGNANYSKLYNGGLGAYTSGVINLNKGQRIYVYVGGMGTSHSGISTDTITKNGAGYNGGSEGNFFENNSNTGGGGGATDIRFFNESTVLADDLVWNSTLGLNSRIIVSAGGGGANSHLEITNYSGSGGDGGGLIGKAAIPIGTYYAYGMGGTQTAGGSVINAENRAYVASSSFGVGGYENHSGGGGGYYGGGDGAHSSAGGGSSFISGYAGVNAITSSADRTHTNNTLHYSNKYFIDGEMQAGVNSGNGKAKITYVGTTYEKKNEKLDNVRYIKDCVNGSSVNTEDHWVELQAITNGINMAKDKNASGTSNTTTAFSYIVDGNIDSSNYTEISTTGLQCITVNLEETYALDEIAVWHYYADGRSYNNHSLYVSSDNEEWTTLIDNVSGVTETSNGIRVSAYD